jgi:hypothetical protein
LGCLSFRDGQPAAGLLLGNVLISGLYLTGTGAEDAPLQTSLFAGLRSLLGMAARKRQPAAFLTPSGSVAGVRPDPSARARERLRRAPAGPAFYGCRPPAAAGLAHRDALGLSPVAARPGRGYGAARLRPGVGQDGRPSSRIAPGRRKRRPCSTGCSIWWGGAAMPAWNRKSCRTFSSRSR